MRGDRRRRSRGRHRHQRRCAYGPRASAARARLTEHNESLRRIMGYYTPAGGLPGQSELLTDRAIVKEAYTVIPKGVLRDIVTSNLPGFSKTRSWIIARP